MSTWADYPIFMAIAETGSLTAAGQKLGISQPTVGRRLKALEDALGGAVLRKKDGHLIPTAFGRSVLEHVRRMDEEAAAITRSSASLEQTLSGPVIIAASDGLGDHWLPFALKDFNAAHPDILIEINIDMKPTNLAQREADVALRWMGPGTQNSLIGRKVVDVGFGLYASPDYIARAGLPQSPTDLKNHEGVTVIHDGESLMWSEIDSASAITPERFAFRTNSVEAHKTAIEAGYGIGPLPHCSIGTRNLVRVLPEFEKVIELWVVAHEELRKSAKVRAVFDYLVTALQNDSAHMRNGTLSCLFGCSQASAYHQYPAPSDNSQAISPSEPQAAE